MAPGAKKSHLHHPCCGFPPSFLIHSRNHFIRSLIFQMYLTLFIFLRFFFLQRIYPQLVTKTNLEACSFILFLSFLFLLGSRNMIISITLKYSLLNSINFWLTILPNTSKVKVWYKFIEPQKLRTRKNILFVYKLIKKAANVYAAMKKTKQSFIILPDI